MIIKKSGQHFDPEVVDAFVAKNEEFYRIFLQFNDDFSEDNNSAFLLEQPTIHE
jgi:HD-GYP domain-containing protein (c-di-GMP phosphodiesterase class II)